MPYFGKTPAETALQTDDLENDVVSTSKLADLNVTEAKLANDSVTGAKLNIPLVAGDVIYASGTDTMAKLAKGTAAQVLTMNAGATAPEWAAAGGGLQSVQVFTSSGTWTRPANITHIDITVIGGGGGGGATGVTDVDRAASGGGSGEEAHLFLDVSSRASETVTIGAAGAAGDYGATAAGGTGGTTTFAITGGTNLTAIGGAGGNPSNTVAPKEGGIGGTGGAGADYAFPGYVGHPNGSASLLTGNNMSGAGGGRGAGNGKSGDGAGTAAIANSGGGGGGAKNSGGSVARLGGLGGSGICIVKEYIK